jgi:TPR repeat protein
MTIRPFVGPAVLVAAVIAAWTWPPSARLLRGGLENNIGYLCLHGVLVAKDSRQAINWYTRAADRGLAVAEYNLGYIYQTGNGIPADARAAEHWYEQAAAQDHAEAANNLAMMYTDGSLGSRDMPRARAWLARAKAAASKDSAAVLAENLAALEHDMSADEIARSESLLAVLPHTR